MPSQDGYPEETSKSSIVLLVLYATRLLLGTHCRLKCDPSVGDDLGRCSKIHTLDTQQSLHL